GDFGRGSGQGRRGLQGARRKPCVVALSQRNRYAAQCVQYRGGAAANHRDDPCQHRGVCPGHATERRIPALKFTLEAIPPLKLSGISSAMLPATRCRQERASTHACAIALKVEPGELRRRSYSMVLGIVPGSKV